MTKEEYKQLKIGDKVYFHDLLGTLTQGTVRGTYSVIIIEAITEDKQVYRKGFSKFFLPKIMDLRSIYD